MIINGGNLNRTKDIVKSVRKHFAGPVEKKQKDIGMPCLVNLVPHAWKKAMNSILKIRFDYSIVFLFVLLVASRLIGMPGNFTPILALAVVLPSISNNKHLPYLLPASVLFITDLVLGLHALAPVVYACVLFCTLLATYMPKRKLLATFYGVLVWHIVVNGGVYLMSAPGTSLLQTYIQAYPFDFKLLVSSMLYVSLFNLVQKSVPYQLQYTK